MTTDLLNALRTCLKEFFPLYKTRLDTFCVLIVGVLGSRTVNLSHIAGTFPGPAEISSNYRRLQRFFQHTRLDFDALARFIVRFMGIENGPWMLAISYKGVGIPLMWTVPGQAGNSGTKHRTALFKRFCKVFGADKIAALTGDREFVGNGWGNFLIPHNIPFILYSSDSKTRKMIREYFFV